MIVLDLKLALFIALLGVVGAIALVGWFRGARRPGPPRFDSTLQQVYQAVPFGIVILGSDGTIVSSNTTAALILHGLGASTPLAAREMLQRFYTPSQTAVQQSGMIHQPLPVRWWRYSLGDEGTLLVLSEG
jgi:hypothetical protein